MKCHDTELTEYTTCPLGTFELTEEVTETCANELLRWLTLETFNKRQVPLPVIRKKFVSLWNNHWPVDLKRDGTRYWAGIRVGRRVAATLWTLFDKYEVLRPYQVYELPVGPHVVTGGYAIIGRRKPDALGEDGPYVLMPHPFRPKMFTPPDLVALVRWKHAMMSGEYVGLGIYHLALLRGKNWRNRTVAEPLVLPWLQSTLDAMAQNLRFPIPSGSCTLCNEQECMEVFVR